MGLDELRNEINGIDDKILELFSERMDVCRKVGEYKIENKISVMQGGREKEILDKVRKNAPTGLEDGAALLFQNIMDISKSLQNTEMAECSPRKEYPEFIPSQAKKLACQGTAGSYSETACRRLFGGKPIDFYSSFEEVFEAVDSGNADFGILPLQNSTIGSVSETYELMAKHDFYINSLVRTPITHCLAAKNGTKLSEIKLVYSKNEAISQCSDFLTKNGLKSCEYANTAMSAKMVAESSEKIACVCSEHCAKLYGLEIITSKIADVYPNYTRFICFSKNFTVNVDSNIISVQITIPHTKGTLNRLLTKFAVNGLNLLKIESKTIAGSDFEVMFYLDFSGNCGTPKVAALIENLSKEMPYFRLLGNFGEVIQ